MKAGHRYDSWLTEKVDKAIPAVTRNIDCSIWHDGIDGCSSSRSMA